MKAFFQKLWNLRWLFLKIYIFFFILEIVGRSVLSILELLIRTFIFCVLIMGLGIGYAEIQHRNNKK